MKWPWISRSTFEEREAEHRERFANMRRWWEELWREEHDRVKGLMAAHDNLVQQMLQMKRQGFGPPPWVDASGAEEDQLPDGVWEAMCLIARPGSATFARMNAQVWTEYKNGVTEPEALIALIREGQDPDALIGG